MKLTQSQKRDLADILGRLKQAETFIKSQRVTVICDFGSMGRKEINKDIGSNLVYLYRTVSLLESFIESN